MSFHHFSRLTYFARILTFMVFMAGAAPEIGRAGEPSDDFMNLRLNPVPLVVHGLGLEADFRIGDAWSIGPTLGAATLYEGEDGTQIKAGALGIRVDYTFGGQAIRESHWYLSLFLEGIPLTLTRSVGSTELSAQMTVGHSALLLGYQWRWDRGFNIRLGAGISHYAARKEVALRGGGLTLTTDVESLTQIKEVFPALDFTIGWAF